MPQPPVPTPPPAPGTHARSAGGDTRPASLWPESAQGFDTALGQDALSQFDAGAAARAAPVDERLALCRPALALRLLLAVLLAVALAAAPASPGARAWLFQLPGPLCAAFAGGLLWLSSVCALQGRLAGRPVAVLAGVLATLGAGAGAVGWGLVVLLGVAEPRAWPLLAAAACGAGLAAVALGWLLLRARAVRPATDTARLAELQSRIRPHFLFNALNTALALLQVDPPRAEAVLEDLSALFRVALAETGSAVSLDDEVDLAQRYLAIEQIRFGPRLAVTWDLDPAAATARLPPLVLQPLVENAVRHGVEPAAGGGHVTVRSRVYRGMVSLEVINSLPPEPGPPGSGLALDNVRERLRLLHDLAGRLHTEQRDGQFIARIEVPL